MKTNKSLLLVLAVNALFAQENTTAKIEAVTKNGLHKIILTPEIRSFSKEDLSDFRIFDSNQKEVPYSILTENHEQLRSRFIPFEVLSKVLVPRKNTSLIVANPQKTIDQIVLSISNTDITKPYSISGSNDQKEWFGLVNNSQLTPIQNTQTTSDFKTVFIPLNSYRFLKIILDDKKTLPIDVLQIGQFTTEVLSNSKQEIVAKSIQTSQLPSQKKTQIHIVFEQPQVVNQIAFEISNPSLFQREARLYQNTKQEVKHKITTFQESLFEFELNSDTKNSFIIPQLFQKELFIEIENQDNQALEFSKIRFFQSPITILADLKANENYTIKTGNPKWNTPHYDLENFINKINTALPIAVIGKIEHPTAKETKSKNQSVWQQAWFMWVCISFVGLILLYFSTQLVKDMKK